MFDFFKRYRRKFHKTNKEPIAIKEEVTFGFEGINTNMDQLAESLTCEVTFVFEGANTSMDQFAKSLESIFGIGMYLYQFSMIGPWYSSIDLNPDPKRQSDGKSDAAKEVSDEESEVHYLEIRSNNCPSDEGGPEFPNAGDYILMIVASSRKFPQIERELGETNLKFKEVLRTYID